MVRLSELAGLTGIVAFPANPAFFTQTDGFDGIVIAVFEAGSTETSILHYIKDGMRIQERRYAVDALEKQAYCGEHRNIIHWIVQGEIWVDRRGYLEGLQKHLADFPDPDRERRLFAEFASFLRTYLQSKEYLQAGHVLDAYSNILEALHHWARIILIEEGVYPEVTVWQQVRTINAGVYKLYEELTTSCETLTQRVELVLLACEFSVMSKMESCCGPVLRHLAESAEPLGIGELINREDFRDFAPQLPILLSKLARKMLIREVAVPAEGDLSLMEVKYTK